MDTEALGDKYLEKGKSSATSKNVFKGKSRYTDAIEYFERAVNQYMQCDAFDKAATALEASIDVYKTHLIPNGDGSNAKLAKQYEELGGILEAVDLKRAQVHVCLYAS